jgi:hypothetical protein
MGYRGSPMHIPVIARESGGGLAQSSMRRVDRFVRPHGGRSVAGQAVASGESSHQTATSSRSLVGLRAGESQGRRTVTDVSKGVTGSLKPTEEIRATIRRR